jgi:multidrug efflux system membrane fusion protein
VVINQVRPILVRFAIPSSQLALLMQHGAQNGGLPVSAVPGGVAPPGPSIDSMAAEVSNPVDDAQGAAASMHAGSTVSSGGNVMQQGGLAGDPVTGTLSFIDNAVDTATGTVQLKARFDNASGTLWAGQFAATSLHLFDEDSVLVVPSDAVVTGQRGAYVYVVDQADTARQRAVTVERVAGSLAIVSSGVQEGDRVVVEGQSRLTPDAAVRIGAPNGGSVPGADGARRGGRGGKGGRGRGGKRGG